MKPLTCRAFLIFGLNVCSGFVAKSFVSPPAKVDSTRRDPLMDKYQEALSVIDESAVSGENSESLYEAVRFIEKNAHKLYRERNAQDTLWRKAQSSWELILSTGDPRKNKSFHKPPAFLPFSFAMIDNDCFGNGIGLNENNIWLSFKHNAFFYPTHRRMVVCLSDVYLFGQCITSLLPPFLQEAFNKIPDDYKEKQPPTFVLVACSENALVARGNQSGGLAIWRRLDKDIHPVAYGKRLSRKR